MHRAVHDAVDFNRFCFTQQSLGVALGAVPFYLVAHQMDRNINDSFFCWGCHQNICKTSPTAHKFLDYASIILAIAPSFCALIPSLNPDLRCQAEIFMSAMPFVWLVGEHLLKAIQVNAFLRPKHGRFDWRKNWYGGCPSGHMMWLTFSISYWGHFLGPMWAVPMTAFAGIVCAEFTVSNRHYISQYIVGGALGLIYGLAGIKAFDCAKYHFGLEVEPVCGDSVGLRCSYAF